MLLFLILARFFPDRPRTSPPLKDISGNQSKTGKNNKHQSLQSVNARHCRVLGPRVKKADLFAEHLSAVFTPHRTPIGSIHSSHLSAAFTHHTTPVGSIHSTHNTYRQYLLLTKHLSAIFTPHRTPIGSIHSCCMLHAWTPKGHFGGKRTPFNCYILHCSIVK